MMRLRNIGFMIPAVLLGAAMVAGCAGDKIVNKNRPLVENRAQVEKYSGRRVLIIGVFKKKNAGKTWVSYISLEDGTSVIYRYRVDPKEAEKFLGKKVRVEGKIHKGPPPSDFPQQRLLSPHVVNVGSIIRH